MSSVRPSAARTRASAVGARSSLPELLQDLAAEQDRLDAMVSAIDPRRWAWPSAARGWSIGSQIGHLCWSDLLWLDSIESRPAFASTRVQLANDKALIDVAAHEMAQQGMDLCLQRWRSARQQLSDALISLPDGARVEWMGPSMTAASVATSRIMEVWAHGWDVAVGLGVPLDPDRRLRHVADLAVRARPYALASAQLDPDSTPVAVRLALDESNEVFMWGDEDADDLVAGSLYQFCLVATRRLALGDSALEVRGAAARRWMHVIRAFA